jgi:hypothetical protein
MKTQDKIIGKKIERDWIWLNATIDRLEKKLKEAKKK